MNKDDIIKWAKKLRVTHKIPLTKLELPGNKFYLPSGSEVETESIKNSLKSLTDVLHCERVERRCARAVANWLPEQKQAEVTKVTAVLKNFGYANKTGRFLYPEEALFLLETNRLELFWNNVPLSIQQAYEVILNDSDTNLKYMAYKELTLQGFRIVRTEHIRKLESVGEPSPKKFKLSDQEIPQANTQSREMFGDVFKKLQENAPKKFNPNTVTKTGSNYQLFKTDNYNKTLPDFSVHIFEGKCIEPNLNFLENNGVVAYTDGEFMKYFRITHVDIPDLT